MEHVENFIDGGMHRENNKEELQEIPLVVDEVPPKMMIKTNINNYTTEGKALLDLLYWAAYRNKKDLVQKLIVKAIPLLFLFASDSK